MARNGRLTPTTRVGALRHAIDQKGFARLLEAHSGLSAIVVENKFGSVVIDQPGFGTEIPDEKSPPSPVRRMQLRTLDNLLRVIRSPVRTGPMRRP